MDKSANYYETFTDFFKSQTDTINFEEGGTFEHFSLAGSFDARFQSSKNRFVSEKSVLLYTALKYHAYTILVQSQTELDKDFVTRLYGIYDALNKNLMRKAKYLGRVAELPFNIAKFAH